MKIDRVCSNIYIHDPINAGQIEEEVNFCKIYSVSKPSDLL